MDIIEAIALHEATWSKVDTHISDIKVGDTVLHNGKEMTVGKKNITRDAFTGTAIFGDSYNSGKKFVTKLVYNNPMNRQRR